MILSRLNLADLGCTKIYCFKVLLFYIEVFVCQPSIFGLTAWNLFWIFKLIKAFISQKKISDFLLMTQIFWIYWIFQGLFTVQLSMCCEAFQPLSQICSSDSLVTISLWIIFVNNFFHFLTTFSKSCLLSHFCLKRQLR